MGWRAMRLGLDRPALMRAQVRALIGPRPGGSCASCSRWCRGRELDAGARLVERRCARIAAPQARPAPRGSDSAP